MQDVDNIVNGQKLFLKPEYQEVLENKKQFESSVGATNFQKVEEIAEWTKSWEYREKNLSREAITINPAKACQPLGAVMVGLGFENTMPYVHGSHGCVAYFRTYFTRHFKEPTPCVSDSMSESAAVFGGLANMKDGLRNCNALYKPDMIAVSTTCMAEVIGDDLNAFVTGAREYAQGELDNVEIPYAHTPSFVGSHITGYDNMMKATLEQLNPSRTEKVLDEERINIIPGFEPYLGSLREIKNISKMFSDKIIMIGDHEEQWDTGAGEYKLYAGGTKIEDAKTAINAKATISLQKYSTVLTAKTIKNKWKQDYVTCNPIGLSGTDAFVMKLSELTNKEVPNELKNQRAKLVDAMQDSYSYMHGKKFAIWGDPDFLLGMVSFLIEMGSIPTHIVCHNAPRKGWEDDMKTILDKSNRKEECNIWPGKDLWALRSLLFTEPVDFMIGNVYGKELYRDTKIPLIRIGFPIFDRHHLHRYSISGYEGGINLLTWITNSILDHLDEETKNIAQTDYFFDAVR
ncbi:nitrogenase molybdenum-iron protein subunit beta [Malaciobacter molluscorum LMG 25693]|uniref:Nitrogenase molybdenum-iron protein beta chain n=1 Tax=Malaciobacter molluscorum LMG 25693 TaxID=870501 RepID=A0A2G1DIW6_9BACT|nr:nitrogenase molybdenum-iron protein subunit beta [Malaciobacter molluscorum]AXX93198.1 [Fe-Mo] nitrogenase complex, dinitrogenase component, beta subunit [Malaciobacter molluscorum LMG 25693]PHO18453.1 nitrogenase molybdenum-iron protein subunit beta [Malaciobacter molluscorum LMG 25693]